jgi:hypothetical protein
LTSINLIADFSGIIGVYGSSQNYKSLKESQRSACVYLIGANFWIALFYPFIIVNCIVLHNKF